MSTRKHLRAGGPRLCTFDCKGKPRRLSRSGRCSGCGKVWTEATFRRALLQFLDDIPMACEFGGILLKSTRKFRRSRNRDESAILTIAAVLLVQFAQLGALAARKDGKPEGPGPRTALDKLEAELRRLGVLKAIARSPTWEDDP